MNYTHAKLQGSRMCRTEITEGAESAPPSLPRASNTLGLIGLNRLDGSNSLFLAEFSLLSRLLEKVALSQLFSYTKYCGLLSGNQFAFSKLHNK